MRVLCVCLGNICRSPAAEALLKKLVLGAGLNVEIHSCALGHWNDGSLPDPRMCRLAQKRGLEITGKAKGPSKDLFDSFDLILAADRSVMRELCAWTAIPAHRAKVKLLGDYSSTHPGADIPDPYHGSEADFEESLDLIEDACYGVFNSVLKQVKT